MSVRRILVYGVTGSGKSTLAKQISLRTGIPFVPVDEIAWEPGWKPVSEEIQRQRYTEACSQEAWVLDSAYSNSLDLVLERAELIVALDYPRWLSFARLMRRTVHRIVSGELVCNGNRESLRQVLSRDSILIWHFRSFTSKRERIRKWLSEGRSIQRHRNPYETSAWLQEFANEINRQKSENSC